MDELKTGLNLILKLIFFFFCLRVTSMIQFDGINKKKF